MFLLKINFKFDSEGQNQFKQEEHHSILRISFMKNIMKPSLIFCAFWMAFAMSSCDKKNQEPETPVTPAVIVDMGIILPYQIDPTAPDSLKISIVSYQERKLRKLTLLTGNQKLVEINLTINPTWISNFLATLEYPFKANETYSFLIETEKLRDTILHYHINNYSHIFKRMLKIQKIMDLTQVLSYDLDPSRKVFFIQDYINNEFSFKKVSLEDYTTEILPDITDAFILRAISATEILSTTAFFNNHYLLSDSAALLKYDLVTGETKFIDWISGDYTDLSRIVNNHIFYNNPVFTSKTTVLLDLSSGSKTVYPYTDGYPYTVQSENFDNIYDINSNVLDLNSEYFVKKINIPDNSYIVYSDDVNQYSYAIQTNYTGNDSFSRLLVYKGNDLLHEGNFEENCNFVLGKIIKVVDNKMIYYKYYGFSTNGGVSGYYSLDLVSGENTLVHCYSNYYIMRDFQLRDNEFLSLRNDGLYKFSL